jgi:acetyl-CoA carboxylase alpha subunit
MSSSITRQIDFLVKQINNIQTEIAQIDMSTSNGSLSNDLLVEHMTARRNNLNRKLIALNTLKDELTINRTNQAIGFTSNQQYMISDIKSRFGDKYNNQITTLQGMSSNKKNEFFTMYGSADSTYVKESAIRSFFR